MIDNSIYWLCEKNASEKEITVKVYPYQKSYAIDFIDNGTGIDKEFIVSEIIFEPEFSLKTNGTGLGLALAGEAASRNNFKLIANEHENGAFFKLVPKGESDNE